MKKELLTKAVVLKNQINQFTEIENIGFMSARGVNSIYTVTKTDGKLLNTINHFNSAKELVTALETILNFKILVR